jgi:hypothetical protein
MGRTRSAGETNAAIAVALDQVGPRLKRVRTRRRMTLTGVADITGISKSTRSRLETGGRAADPGAAARPLAGLPGAARRPRRRTRGGRFADPAQARPRQGQDRHPPAAKAGRYSLRWTRVEQVPGEISGANGSARRRCGGADPPASVRFALTTLSRCRRRMGWWVGDLCADSSARSTFFAPACEDRLTCKSRAIAR